MAISYLPTFIPTKVLIVGCGGTGSRLVPLLAQFIKACPWVIDPEMTLIDDDIVEDKNLLRQNFISTDVGKYKAEVLAQRYSRAFNMKITASRNRVVATQHQAVRGRQPTFPAYVPASQEQIDIFQKHGKNSIIVLCVDSPEARRDIITNMAYPSGSSVLVLDSGNENDFGQVSVSTWTKVSPMSSDYKEVLKAWPNSIPGNMTLPFIPTDLSYFYDMVAADTLSCADLDQTMAINTMMANAMFGIIQNIFYSKPITYHRLDVTLSNGVTPQYMSPRWLTKMSEYHPPVVSLDKTKDRVNGGVNTHEGISKQDVWARSGELAAVPCHSSQDISDAIYEFDRRTWKPFKKLNDQAENAAKAKAEADKQVELATFKAKIERETRALVKREMIAELANAAHQASLVKAGLKTPEAKVPESVSKKSSVATISSGSDQPWPFEKPEVIQMSPEAIKAIKASLKEQDKLREARFQARLQEVTAREASQLSSIAATSRVLSGRAATVEVDDDDYSSISDDYDE